VWPEKVWPGVGDQRSEDADSLHCLISLSLLAE